MKESLRKSGIDIVKNLTWGTHFCLFYQTEKDLMDILIPYFKTGLENSEFCVLITPQSPGPEEVKVALKNEIFDLDLYLEKGQIEIISCADWYLEKEAFNSENALNSWIEKITGSLDSNYNGMRISFDVSWLRQEDWDRFTEYKKQIDEVINNSRILALSTCSLNGCNLAEIIDITLNYQSTLVKKNGQWEQVEGSGKGKENGKVSRDIKNCEAWITWDQTFDAISDLVAIIDKDYRLVRVNRAMAAKFRVSPEECIGLTCYRAVHGTNQPPTFCPHKQLLEDGLGHTVEIEEKVLGGIFSISLSPLYNPEGELIGGIHIARNITDSKQAEKSLLESEAKYRNIIETASEGIWILDSEERTTFVNKKMAEMLGYSQEEMLGQSGWDFIGERDEAIIKLNKEMRQWRIEGSSDLKLIRKSGSYLWVHINIKSFFDKEGKFTGAIGLLTDITKKKEIEKALKLSNLYNRSLIEASLDPLVTIGHDGKITDVNGATELVTGYSRDYLIGTDFSDYFTEPEKAKKGYQQVFTDGKVWNYPLEIRHKDGHITSVLYNASVYGDEAGEIIGVFAAARDITELKKAEEKIQRLANAVESSEDAIITRSLDGVILSWNKGAEKIYGYLTGEILGKEMSILEPDELKGEIRSFSDKIKQGERVQHYETVRLKKDGTRINISATLSPVYDASGKLVAISTIARDITEQKRAEEALRFSNLYNRSLIEASLDPLVTIGQDGKIKDVNKATEIVTGRSREELIGKDFSDYFANPEKARRGYLQAFMYGEVRDYLLEIRHREGKIIPVLYNASVYRSETGRVIGVFAAARDITDSKKAERALRASEAKYRKIVETAQEGIWLIDENDRTVFVNQKTSEMLGYNIEEILGQSPRKFMAPEFCLNAEDRLQEHMYGVNHVIDYRFIRKDGSDLWCILSSSSLFDDQGKFTGSLAMIMDITERKKVEEALKESEKRFQSVLENSLDSAYRFDLQNDCFDYMSSVIEKITGFFSKEIEAMTSNDLLARIHPDDRPRVIAGLTQSLDEGFGAHEYRFKCKDGEYCWLADHFSIIKDKTGIARFRAGIAHDVTERKKAEEAVKKAYDNLETLVKERTAELQKAYQSLKESEKGLAEAQRMAHIGNWDWNVETGEGYWSDELYRIFGRSPQKSSPSYDELLNYIHPEDRDFVDKSIKRGLNKGPKDGIDYRIVLDTGEERIVHSRAKVVFNEKNIPLRVKGIVQDITEQEKAQEKIRNLVNAVESSNDAIVTLSFEGIVTSWNKGAEQIYGCAAEEILGKNVSIIEPDDLKGEIKSFCEKIKNGEQIQHYEAVRLKKDGTLVNISAALSPVFSTGGELVAVLAISRDITERIETEKTLAKMDKLRIKEIHHRIKNNLQVITSLLDLQAEKFQDKQVLEAFKESQSRVVSMALIHEELYKGEGTDTLNFSAYLQKLAETLFHTYSLRSKNISLVMDLEKSACFNMDIAVPLGIIVNELVSNSLKHAFNENEKGEIRIKLWKEIKDNQTQASTFNLKISDNGKGIPENIRLESFESLGLKLVSILIEQLDGKIEFGRENGTEFRIIFKVAGAR
jgi:PAS domain S-box-containing protein